MGLNNEVLYSSKHSINPSIYIYILSVDYIQKSNTIFKSNILKIFHSGPVR